MLLARFLSNVIRDGELTLIDARGRTHVVGAAINGDARATIRLRDRSLHRKLLLNPRLHFGEAYMNGSLTIEDGTIQDLLDVLTRNNDNVFKALPRPVRWLLTCAEPIVRRLQQHNPMGRARRNVAHHYDLSSGLYDMFLDEDRQYSAAYFTSNNQSLEEAQDNKKRHIAAKLLLEPGQKVLDIGSGWGGLGLYLAQTAEIDLTGVTLSREQHKISQERARTAKLHRRVRFELCDYRTIEDSFDRIVSVGMFEHVGAGHYREFFRKVRDLLTEDGVMLLHSIGRMSPPGTTNPWMRKYVFPGGYTPALSETLAAIEKTGLYVTDIEILRGHYADTLKEWKRRFQNRRAEVAEMYDERFCRMWEFYLNACEYSFRNMDQMVFQIQLAKNQNAAPITRDYIAEWEAAH